MAGRPSTQILTETYMEFLVLLFVISLLFLMCVAPFVFVYQALKNSNNPTYRNYNAGQLLA